MELIKLFNLQGSLFIMILAGAVLKRKGIIDEPGKRCLTDLCVNIIIPCNIVKSCLIEFDISIMKACGLLLAVGIVMQLLCVFLNRFLFDGFEEHQKKVLQYCTIVSNGGFWAILWRRGSMGNWDFCMRPYFSFRCVWLCGRPEHRISYRAAQIKRRYYVIS